MYGHDISEATDEELENEELYYIIDSEDMCILSFNCYGRVIRKGFGFTKLFGIDLRELFKIDLREFFKE